MIHIASFVRNYHEPFAIATGFIAGEGPSKIMVTTRAILTIPGVPRARHGTIVVQEPPNVDADGRGRL